MSADNTKQLSGHGEVYSYTIIGNPDNAPSGYEQQTPYVVALVKLAEGPLIAAQLTDLNYIEKKVVRNGEEVYVREYPELEIGLYVEMVTRKLKEEGERGLIVYGYKFRPRLCPETS